MIIFDICWMQVMAIIVYITSFNYPMMYLYFANVSTGKMILPSVLMTYGFSYYLGYMSVDTSHAAMGQYIPMVSPPFHADGDYCILFDFKVWASPHTLVNTPVPELQVSMSGSKHVYSGRQLWVSNGTGEGHAQISIWALPGSVQRIGFFGIIGDLESTHISIANILLKENGCTMVDCARRNCTNTFTTSILSMNGRLIFHIFFSDRIHICMFINAQNIKGMAK